MDIKAKNETQLRRYRKLSPADRAQVDQLLLDHERSMSLRYHTQPGSAASKRCDDIALRQAVYENRRTSFYSRFSQPCSLRKRSEKKK